MTDEAKRAWDIALDIINTEDFEIVYDYLDNEDYEPDYYFRLIDTQGANLGGIESELFDDLVDVLDRLEIYHEDYFRYDEDEYGETYERLPGPDTTWENDYLRFLNEPPCKLLDKNYIEDHKDDEDLQAILKSLRYEVWYNNRWN